MQAAPDSPIFLLNQTLRVLLSLCRLLDNVDDCTRVLQQLQTLCAFIKDERRRIRATHSVGITGQLLLAYSRESSTRVQGRTAREKTTHAALLFHNQEDLLRLPGDEQLTAEAECIGCAQVHLRETMFTYTLGSGKHIYLCNICVMIDSNLTDEDTAWLLA